jgi:peptidyl-prolyl cis-trans isomerase C
MLGKTLAATLSALLVAGLLLSGCGGSGRGQVVARVGGTSITHAELRAKLAELPPFTQQQFSGPDGLIEFLDRVIEEEVLYQAAKRAGYDRDPMVVRTVEAVQRRSMIQAYYKTEIEGATTVPEEKVVAYYDEHPELFKRPGRVKFRHILVDTRTEARQARNRVIEGQDFASVARKLSKDPGSRDAGGLVGALNKGDSLPSAGMSGAFIASLFDGTVGQVSEPLRSDKGWHIVRIEELSQEGVKPLDEVRARIVDSLMPAETREYYLQMLEQLKSQLNATVNEAAFRKQPRSEEELFTLAQDTEDPYRRLGYYSELVIQFPDGEHAAEAQFMVGFIQAEELGDFDAARKALQRMLDKYPDAELRESAEWMLKNMGKEAPPFDDSDLISSE